jgi:hypothetical protein
VIGNYADQANAMAPTLFTVAHNRIAGGNTIYLPFYPNHITSFRLTNPAPIGVTFFYTDNLSGCRFFIDTIGGSNDLIVYHANTTHNTSGANAWADVQLPAAGNTLTTLRTNARGDGPYAGLLLNNAAILDMPRYFRQAGLEERRKGQGPQGRNAPALAPAGRNRPQFLGGCFVCGFYSLAGWEFWFQSWGDFGYTRPGYLRGLLTFDWVGVHKRRTEGDEKLASYANMRVLERFQFH